MSVQPAKPKVVNLGTCVVERDGKHFLVMFPDGSVSGKPNYTAAVKGIKAYFAKHTPKDAIGVGQMTSYDGSIIPLAVNFSKVHQCQYVTEI